MNDQIQPNYNAFERHAQTAMTSLVVLLLAGVVALIFKINEDQVQQLIELKTLKYQVQQIALAQTNRNGYAEREVERLDYSLNTIWPRLRAQSENIEILKSAIEREHLGLNINLTEPEKF
jgi:uncharacterized membrane protein